MLLRANHYCKALFVRSAGKNRQTLGSQRVLVRFFGEGGLVLVAVQKWINGENPWHGRSYELSSVDTLFAVNPISSILISCWKRIETRIIERFILRQHTVESMKQFTHHGTDRLQGFFAVATVLGFIGFRFNILRICCAFHGESSICQVGLCFK